MSRRALFIAVWLLVVALCVGNVFRTRFTADLSAFLPQVDGVLVVADERTWTAAGQAVQQSLLDAGVTVADPLIFAVNQEVWDSFTPEDQEIVATAAVDAGAYGVEVARRGLTDEDQSLIEEIEGHGVTVVRLTDEERQAFVDATRPVYEAWREKVGADLVKQAEESVAQR